MYNLESLSQVRNIRSMKEYNAERGQDFFSPASMRFFDSRIAPGIIQTWSGIVFITSEKFDYSSPRLYTVRIMAEDGSCNELNCEFQQFESLYQARRHARIEADKLNQAPAPEVTQ